MEEIVFVKRSSHRQLRTYKKPVIKLELTNGRFIISQILAKSLGVIENDGLMFGFNQKAKTAYVVKDDEDDAFILKQKDQHTLRFTSKDLMQFFVDTFELLETGKSTFVFDVNIKPNERGLHIMSLT